MSTLLLVSILSFVIIGIIAIIYAYTPIIKGIIKEIKEKLHK